MKSIWLVICWLGFTWSAMGGVAWAQMKVGNSPMSLNADAVLEVEHTSKGLLLPRVALSSTSLASPLSAHVAGMSVYNTATTGDVIPGVYTNNGSRWVSADTSCICGEVKMAIVSSLGGNWRLANGTAAGTNSCGLGTLPNASNAYPSMNGATLGSIANANTKTLAQNQLPNVNLTAQNAGGHTHTNNSSNGNGGYGLVRVSNGESWTTNGQLDSTTGEPDLVNRPAALVIYGVADHTHSVPLNGNVTQQALDIRPLTMSVNVFVCVN